ncbi:MAG TPA: indoleacetamide hydrolase [Bryobacteraceae bacterium]|jgi:mandelamide amidase|nr:indoleacetamide hydrolase [Bryobacteraceae bacterium]
MNFTRRDALKIGAATVLATPPLATPTRAAGRATESEMTALTAVEAAGWISRGEMTAEAYVSTLLARAERLKDLDVFIALNNEGALSAARAIDLRRKKKQKLGLLAGVPLIVKDNIDAAGLAATAGCRGLAENRPSKNAPVLVPLLAADGILLGKANMHELADGITSNNGGYGAVHNPYNTSMIPGGSSGGTAAGIAARIAPAGLGTDTAGSVRIPSSLCGVAGLRPTSKRYSLEGIVPLSHTRDTAGPIARTVADVALLDAVITGSPATPRASLSGLRLGLPREYFWVDLDPETETVMNEAIRRLKDLGVVFVEASPAGLADLTRRAGNTIGYEMLRDIAAYLAADHSTVTVDAMIQGIKSPDVVRAVARIKSNPADEAAYNETVNKWRPQLQQLYADYFAKNNVEAMFFPTTPLPARPIGEDQTVDLNGKKVSTIGTYTRNAAPGSSAGMPGLTLPAGRGKSGLPIGMELDGPMGSDRKLLAIGIAMEAHLGPLPAPSV